MYTSAMANITQLNDELFSSNFPLHAACYRGNVELTKKLLNEGFDVYLEDSFRAWTPVHWAACSGQWKCLDLINQLHQSIDWDIHNRRYTQTPVHVAAVHGHTLCIQWLVTRGASLEMQDYLGDTPLHKAAKSGILECVRLLTSHSPLLSITNKDGHTALDVAEHCGADPELCRVLRDAALYQHSAFFPTSSSPIEMNGEGIYCSPTKNLASGDVASNSADQDMEMGDDSVTRTGSKSLVGVGADGDYRALSIFSCIRFGALKRGREEEEGSGLKRQRLFEPTTGEKLGTASNNNVLSSYNSVLAMSATPSKSVGGSNPLDQDMHQDLDMARSETAAEHAAALGEQCGLTGGHGVDYGGGGVCARYRCTVMNSPTF